MRVKSEFQVWCVDGFVEKSEIDSLGEPRTESESNKSFRWGITSSRTRHVWFLNIRRPGKSRGQIAAQLNLVKFRATVTVARASLTCGSNRTDLLDTIIKRPNSNTWPKSDLPHPSSQTRPRRLFLPSQTHFDKWKSQSSQQKLDSVFWSTMKTIPKKFSSYQCDLRRTKHLPTRINRCLSI